MIGVTLARPWLVLDLPAGLRCLSWAPWRPGFVAAGRVAIREVRNADLPAGFDAETWLAGEMAAAGHAVAVGLITARDLGSFVAASAAAGGIAAAAVATVGLGNAEAVGARRGAAAAAGTVNLVVATDAALSEAAQIEALAVAVEARTAAVLAAGLRLPTGLATGTGTDCVVIACRPGAGRYAGTHTAAGEAVGAAARAAVAAGVARWRDWAVAEGIAWARSASSA
jgi:adenosylcobinamide amidohydrolase